MSETLSPTNHIVHWAQLSLSMGIQQFADKGLCGLQSLQRSLSKFSMENVQSSRCIARDFPCLPFICHSLAIHLLTIHLLAFHLLFTCLPSTCHSLVPFALAKNQNNTLGLCSRRDRPITLLKASICRIDIACIS